MALFAMRYLFACAVMSIPAFAGTHLTVVLSFDGAAHSDAALVEMKRETESLLKPSGYTFDWRDARTLADFENFSDVVVVKMTGRCRMELVPELLDERGPLAFTDVTDGEVLPFSTVKCDHVRASVRTALWGGQVREGDRLMGRALGRVVAHELFHILANTRGHAQTGVARHALSAKQLVADRLAFEDEDRALMRRLRAAR